MRYGLTNKKADKCDAATARQYRNFKKITGAENVKFYWQVACVQSDGVEIDGRIESFNKFYYFLRRIAKFNGKSGTYGLTKKDIREHFLGLTFNGTYVNLNMFIDTDEIVKDINEWFWFFRWECYKEYAGIVLDFDAKKVHWVA